ncbi:MAG: GDP-mannose 4,6-dehydratase [Rudaea sp.]
MTTALITGITGQDGAYLAQLLLNKGYRVVGTYRRTSSVNFWRIEELGIDAHPNLELVEHDVTDPGSSIRLVESAEATEIYNFAAQSFVRVSFDQPITTGLITGLGTVHLLEAVRTVDRSIRFYQSSTSEMFGKAQAVPQNETTPFYPRSPYAAAKLYAHWMTVNCRESYGIFASSGIAFNHESPLRGCEFVTRKITDAVAKIALGKLQCLDLGNLDARRDWGFAGEYVDAMWRMLQMRNPGTYVLATGQARSVRDFVGMAFAATGISIEWSGRGENERGLDAASGRELVRVDARHYRPAEVEMLVGDATRAREELLWEPTTTVEQLCAMMVAADLRRNEPGASS